MSKKLMIFGAIVDFAIGFVGGMVGAAIWNIL